MVGSRHISTLSIEAKNNILGFGAFWYSLLVHRSLLLEQSHRIYQNRLMVKMSLYALPFAFDITLQI